IRSPRARGCARGDASPRGRARQRARQRRAKSRLLAPPRERERVRALGVRGRQGAQRQFDSRRLAPYAGSRHGVESFLGWTRGNDPLVSRRVRTPQEGWLQRANPRGTARRGGSAGALLDLNRATAAAGLSGGATRPPDTVPRRTRSGWPGTPALSPRL